jgi:excisionase family DNA binding protein
MSIQQSNGSFPALLVRPEDAAQALGIGRTKVYELMRSGVLRSVKIGGLRRIPAAALAEFVAHLEEDAA